MCHIVFLFLCVLSAFIWRNKDIYNTQVSCSKKWLYALEKSVSPVDCPISGGFHDRNLPEIEHVLFWPVSGASFLYQKNGTRNPIHTGKFSGARNLRQKLAPETCQSI